MSKAERIERIQNQFPYFSFTLTQAWHKNTNRLIFLSMSIPSIGFILLLNFTDKDWSGGGYWLWYYRLYFRIFLFFLCSMVSLIIATNIYRDEISDESIVYLMVKPVKRNEIFYQRYFAYIIISSIIITPNLVIYHIIGDLASRFYDKTFQLPLLYSLGNFFLELIAVHILIIGIGAVFLLTGLWLNRPMLINLLIAFGIILQQFFIDLIPNQFEPVYIAQNLVAVNLIGFKKPITEEFYRFTLKYMGFNISLFQTFINFFVILILTLLIANRISLHKEYS